MIDSYFCLKAARHFEITISNLATIGFNISVIYLFSFMCLFLLVDVRGNDSVYSSNPRKGGYIELAIHGPLWAVHRPYGPLTHIYTNRNL
jgi:hypothetical protein